MILLRILFLTLICIIFLIRGTKTCAVERKGRLFTFYTFIGYYYDFVQNFIHRLSIVSAFYRFVRKMAAYAQFLPE